MGFFPKYIISRKSLWFFFFSYSSIKTFIKLPFHLLPIPLWSSSQELMAQNQEQSADKWVMPGLKPKSSWTDCLTDWSNNLQSHHAGLQIAILSGFDYYGYLAALLKLEFGLQNPDVLPEPNWILLDGKYKQQKKFLWLKLNSRQQQD